MWREKQAKGTSLIDEAYRKACGLPRYLKALLKEWRYVISLTLYGMPLFCETRAASLQYLDHGREGSLDGSAPCFN